MKKIGVTGTRNGANGNQLVKIHVLLQMCKLSGAEEFHHGDCVGVDAQIAVLAGDLGYRVICHPPAKEDLRAFVPSAEYRRPASYFARNRQIVDECDMLIVVPNCTVAESKLPETKQRGGTWYTYNYAVKREKDLILIPTDFGVDSET